jgi:hypothetical protein
MATDLTLEILTNKEKFPDTAEITLADGSKITVKDFRDKLQPRAEFTRASETWAAKERELKTGLDAANQNLAQALKDKEAAIAAGKEPPKPAPTGAITAEELLADPILGPLYKDLKEAREQLKTHEARLAQHEQTWTRTNFMKTIAELKGRDKELNVDEFLGYSQKHPVIDVENQVVDLEATHRNYAHDRLVAAARKEGEAAGIEKGKATQVPTVPFGRRRAPVKPQGLPESLDQLKDDDVLNDPEIQEAMRATE